MARRTSREKSSQGKGLIGNGTIDPALLPYEDQILCPSTGHPVVGGPVYAKNRVELAEALPYFQISEGSTYAEDGLVRGFLLADVDDGEDDKNYDNGSYRGRQGYMDAEVVISRIPPSLPWKNTVTGRVHGKSRKKGRAAVVDQYTAFFATLREKHPLILILDRKWSASILSNDRSQQQITARYVVLDYFLVSNIWKEPSHVAGGQDIYMVRFEKLHLHRASWWYKPEILPPPVHLRDFTPPTLHACPQCGQTCAQIYKKDWFCCNSSCVYFGFNQSGNGIASQDLAYHPTFLKTRHSRNQIFAPIYDLRPDLLTVVKNEREYGLSGTLGNRASAGLWRAIVCPNCFHIVSRIFWHVWKCDICKQSYNYGPTSELYQKWSFMENFGVSRTGHPGVDILVPDDYRMQPPIAREKYRMDRIFLHGDAFITLLSPTEQFNQDESGPNDLFNMLLEQAPTGRLPLRRRRIYPFDSHSGQRTPYFATMYGEQYDFSALKSISHHDTPESVIKCEALLERSVQEELAQHYDDSFNQASLECYFDNMELPWHTNGDRELGSTIAMLSLGSKAELRVRLKQHIYQNSSVVKVIRGAYNWHNLVEVKRLVQSGLSVDTAWSQQQFYTGPREAPEAVVPLVHGSVVIFQGKHFSKYFEHKIENADNDSGSLRFTVTARHIDAAKHKLVKTQHPYARQAGPKFSFIRDLPGMEIQDDDDRPYEEYEDSDSDDSDEDDYQDYSTSGSHDPKWPGKMPRPIPTDAFGIKVEDKGQASTMQRTTRSGRPMRSYADEDDSDSDLREIPDPKYDPKRGQGTNKRVGKASKAKTGRSNANARDRSLSPERTTSKGKSIRIREPTRSASADVDMDQDHEGSGGTDVQKTDPANLPKITGKGKHGGSRLGRKLHWWTPAENEALRQAGLRVTKGQSVWMAELVNMPAEVTYKNCRDRYWKFFKGAESSGNSGGGVGYQ